jgi:hypothetical protein
MICKNIFATKQLEKNLQYVAIVKNYKYFEQKMPFLRKCFKKSYTQVFVFIYILLVKCISPVQIPPFKIARWLYVCISQGTKVVFVITYSRSGRWTRRHSMTSSHKDTNFKLKTFRKKDNLNFAPLYTFLSRLIECLIRKTGLKMSQRSLQSSQLWRDGGLQSSEPSSSPLWWLLRKVEHQRPVFNFAPRAKLTPRGEICPL